MPNRFGDRVLHVPKTVPKDNLDVRLVRLTYGRAGPLEEADSEAVFGMQVYDLYYPS